MAMIINTIELCLNSARSGRVLAAICLISCVLCSPPASAQSTGTDLADLPLEHDWNHEWSGTDTELDDSALVTPTISTPTPIVEPVERPNGLLINHAFRHQDETSPAPMPQQQVDVDDPQDLRNVPDPPPGTNGSQAIGPPLRVQSTAGRGVECPRKSRCKCLDRLRQNLQRRRCQRERRGAGLLSVRRSDRNCNCRCGCNGNCGCCR